MQFIKTTTHFDFIGKRRPALFISTVLNLAILVGIALFGFNFGVDFAGGTLVEVKFKEPISAQQVRERAQKGGLHDVTVQGIGSAEENSFLLRLGGVTQLTREGAAAAETVVRGLGEVQLFRSDLDNGIINVRTKEQVDPQKLREAVAGSGTGVKEVRALGEAQGGGFDYQLVSAGMAEKVQDALKAGAAKADFQVQRIDYVGPQVGKQLRNKGIMALVYAMIAILIYVAFRFEFKFGPGALLAMLHDVVMVCGYFLVSRREFNLTSIAVLLTIIGYSINDTIVIYDRIREEMARFKGKPLPEIINIAVNETLSRTILTGGVTALSLVGLLIFGVGEIFDFAMAMLIGIIVGTYSSVYIASPLTIWLDERAARAAERGGMKARVA
ncbi:MAG: protein translocase subunit SecF [Myxococcota bacterium]